MDWLPRRIEVSNQTACACNNRKGHERLERLVKKKLGCEIMFGISIRRSGDLSGAIDWAMSNTVCKQANLCDRHSSHRFDRQNPAAKCAAVKSPLGAQTVLGDRHDPFIRRSSASAVGRLRNSPERTFQRLGRLQMYGGSNAIAYASPLS